MMGGGGRGAPEDRGEEGRRSAALIRREDRRERAEEVEKLN